VRILLFFYLILTLLVSGRMLLDGVVWTALALMVGVLVDFAGGSGMRGAFYRGQKSSGFIIGIALAFAGMALVFYSGVTVAIFGSTISADLWVFLGFVLGFFAARPKDAGDRVNSRGDAEDIALGTIAPIAAGLAAGRLTPEQAEKQIRDSALIAPEAPALWDSMSVEQRQELGPDFMKVAAHPDFAVRIEKQLEPLKKADPEFWEQSLGRARDELGSSTGGNKP